MSCSASTGVAYEGNRELAEFLGRSADLHRETPETLSGCDCLVVRNGSGALIFAAAYQERSVPFEGDRLVIMASHAEAVLQDGGWADVAMPVFEELAAARGLAGVSVPVINPALGRLLQRQGYRPGVVVWEKAVANG